MPNEIEGAPAPESLEAQALAELEKEGHVVGGHQPIDDNGEAIADQPSKPEPVAEPETPKAAAEPEKEPEEPKVPEKVDRTPRKVDAWKLKVAEDQKQGLEKQVAELQAKVNELTMQRDPITQTQKNDLADQIDDIRALAEKRGVDAEFLTEFADTILKKAESRLRPSSDSEKLLSDLAQERELARLEKEYSDEFEQHIAPLVREKYQLSDQALSEFRTKLKETAFTETYAKVPLIKIFKAEEDAFNFHVPKKASEGKAVKGRQSQVVDLDDLDEAQFNDLPADKVDELLATKRSSGWTRK